MLDQLTNRTNSSDKFKKREKVRAVFLSEGSGKNKEKFQQWF
jgi:hypothetical protein